LVGVLVGVYVGVLVLVWVGDPVIVIDGVIVAVFVIVLVVEIVNFDNLFRVGVTRITITSLGVLERTGVSVGETMLD
jgi:hypothetical protein